MVVGGGGGGYYDERLEIKLHKTHKEDRFGRDNPLTLNCTSLFNRSLNASRTSSG